VNFKESGGELALDLIPTQLSTLYGGLILTLPATIIESAS
jgi:hypothetical protein